jgi:sialic acid synthase SpsE/mannose-6-phosphate isomerase-like protein (cupin superfamily)
VRSASLASRTSANPLIILDLANNHNGSLAHGKSIIDGLALACVGVDMDIAVKFQYRELDTFIHKDFRDRMDMKYVSRFLSTRLSWDEFAELTEYAHGKGFLTAATPFDEASVEYVQQHGHDFLKVASASFTDWPLWESVIKIDLPIVASTAGASVAEVDRVVAFLSHREREFALMHCVAAYPTADENLELNRIDLLRARYAPVPVGYSTHESPGNLHAVGLAVAKGAALLERHVGVASESAQLNEYSSDPGLIRNWLSSVSHAMVMCGAVDGNVAPNESELAALRGLGRGAYLRDGVRSGQPLGASDVYFAIPLQEGQIRANEWSKYLKVVPLMDVVQDQPLMAKDAELDDRRELIVKAVDAVSDVLDGSGVGYPGNVDLELTHHYGIESFNEVGLAMLTVVNRDYCKKILVVLPGQQHPEQFHRQKEEAFHVLFGVLDLWLDDVHRELKPGDLAVVERNVRHRFSSPTGAVFEEISSTHYLNDSFYVDETINQNLHRKSFVRFWGRPRG